MGSSVQYMSKSVDHSIFLECTTAGKIEEIVKSFENGKASDIPIKLVKKSVFFSNHIDTTHHVLQANSILHKDQFGYRKGYSTTQALHKSIDIINRLRARNMF